MMKRIAILMLVLLMLGVSAMAEPFSVVAAIFPQYDWVRNIIGDANPDASVTLLLDKGVDLHNFQPTADDIIRVSECDLFIYVGGESDEWAEDALAEAMNPNQRVIKLLDVLGDAVKEEEIVEGMQAEEEEAEGEEEESEADEHVWLSLRNARTLCAAIAEALCEIDPENAEAYRANCAAYAEKLNALDAEYAAAVSAGTKDTLLFGDRFPFRYLTEDYGLNYYAAFAGCSAETEASFRTIAFLSGKTDELGLNAVMTIEGSDHRIAETVVQNTKDPNRAVLALDSMQSVTAADVANGADYLGIMRKNLEVLKEALK